MESVENVIHTTRGSDVRDGWNLLRMLYTLHEESDVRDGWNLFRMLYTGHEDLTSEMDGIC